MTDGLTEQMTNQCVCLLQSQLLGGGGLRGGAMPASPSVTSVEYGSSATLTVLPGMR